MGLLFILPISQEETDRVLIKDSPSSGPNTLILKSYGLPTLFWGYLVAILTLMGVMFLGTQNALFKLLSAEDFIGQALGASVFICFIAITLGLLALFFYEKVVIKSGCRLKIIHKIFFIPVRQKSYFLATKNAFTIAHHLDSPNMAKINNRAGTRGFQNSGYFKLYGTVDNGEFLHIDRHPRKSDLKKLKEFLSAF